MGSPFDELQAFEPVSKEEFARAEKELRLGLLNAQFDLLSADFSVLLLLTGDDRKGLNEVLDRLHEWLDARHLETHAFQQPTEAEAERPRFWRYWSALPSRGHLGIFFGAWIPRAVAGRLLEGEGKGAFRARLEEARRFEEVLVADGTLVLKVCLHVPKKELKRRLKKAKEEPYVDKRDAGLYERYDEVQPLLQEALERTEGPHAPWHVFDGTDRRARDLAVGRLLLGALQERLASAPPPSPSRALPALPALPGDAPRLAEVDLGACLEVEDYKRRRDELQEEVSELTRRAFERGLSSVLAFEGWDAAGKGGAIRRLTQAMTAPLYRVIPIAAPTEEERARHYLWRFWRHLPRAGRVAIFDRTWYGRVLVERVEGFARPDEWRRAYGEIRDFEEALCARGFVLQKYFLHLDPEEQLRRFEEREDTPYKKHKITPDDYRNRERWPAYVEAIDEMVARTSTPAAPWHLVPANDKRHARLVVLETFRDAISRALA